MAVRGGGKRSKKTRGRQPCGGRRKKAKKATKRRARRTLKGKQRGFRDRVLTLTTNLHQEIEKNVNMLDDQLQKPVQHHVNALKNWLNVR